MELAICGNEHCNNVAIYKIELPSYKEVIFGCEEHKHVLESVLEEGRRQFVEMRGEEYTEAAFSHLKIEEVNPVSLN